MGNVLRNMSQLFSFHQLQLRDTDTDNFISFCPQAQCCFHEFFFPTLKNIPKLVAGLKKNIWAENFGLSCVYDRVNFILGILLLKIYYSILSQQNGL